MGEPEPVRDELERALASMRAGFLSGSSQIAAGVSSLEEHLAGAAQHERERVGAAVAQIVSTQERLIAQIERLPPSSWDRFKSMVGILKAQQAILDDLGALVKEHVLPRQLQGLSVAAASAAQAAAPPPPEPELIPLPAPPPPRRRRVIADDPEPERVRRGSGFKGLAAMIVAAVVLSLIPRETKLHDMAAKLVAFIGIGGQSTPSGTPEADADPPKSPPADPRVARVPREDESSETPGAAPPPAEEKATSRPKVADADAAGKERVALRQPGNKRGAAPKTDGARPPAAGPKQEQFVPVLFTHRDQSTVKQTMNELQQQYPKLLMDRKGEILSVNMGKKGVWHRLAFLPAASRQEATKLCDQLMAEGYDRCWVKVYETD
jgi:hypothetical protein